MFNRLITDSASLWERRREGDKMKGSLGELGGRGLGSVSERGKDTDADKDEGEAGVGGYVWFSWVGYGV